MCSMYTSFWSGVGSMTRSVLCSSKEQANEELKGPREGVGDASDQNLNKTPQPSSESEVCGITIHRKILRW